MKHAMILLIAALGVFLSSCNTTDSRDVDMGSLAGDYTLVDFLVKYENGASLTSSDIAFSGSMNISSAGKMTQHIVINGGSTEVTGQVTEIKSDSVLRISSAGKGYDLKIFVSNDTLKTVMAGSQLGLDYDETDYWKRSSATPKAAASAPGQDGGSLGAALGRAFQ